MNFEEAKSVLLDHCNNYFQLKIGIRVEKLREKEREIEGQFEKHPLGYGKKFNHGEGGLHSNDIALYSILCENSGIDKENYRFNISSDGSHYSFYYTDEVLPIIKKAFLYNLLELAFDRCMHQLKIYFKVNNEISPEELENMEKDAIKEELKELNVPDEYKSFDI